MRDRALGIAVLEQGDAEMKVRHRQIGSQRQGASIGADRARAIPQPFEGETEIAVAAGESRLQFDRATQMPRGLRMAAGGMQRVAQRETRRAEVRISFHERLQRRDRVPMTSLRPEDLTEHQGELGAPGRALPQLPAQTFGDVKFAGLAMPPDQFEFRSERRLVLSSGAPRRRVVASLRRRFRHRGGSCTILPPRAKRGLRWPFASEFIDELGRVWLGGEARRRRAFAGSRNAKRQPSRIRAAGFCCRDYNLALRSPWSNRLKGKPTRAWVDPPNLAICREEVDRASRAEGTCNVGSKSILAFFDDLRRSFVGDVRRRDGADGAVDRAPGSDPAAGLQSAQSRRQDATRQTALGL